MMYVYTVEYHSAIKKNEIVTSATKWMVQKSIMLKEISQWKPNAICYHIYLESKI